MIKIKNEGEKMKQNVKQHMNRLTKVVRKIFIAICIIVVVSITPINSQATEKKDPYEWYEGYGILVINDYEGAHKWLEENWEKANEVKELAFYSSKIKRETGGAFRNVTKITIHEGVEEVEDEAFLGTKVSNIVFPDTVKKIGRDIFRGIAEIEKIEFQGSDVPEIDENAFRTGKNKEQVMEIVTPKESESLYKEKLFIELGMEKVNVNGQEETKEEFEKSQPSKETSKEDIPVEKEESNKAETDNKKEEINNAETDSKIEENNEAEANDKKEEINNPETDNKIEENNEAEANDKKEEINNPETDSKIEENDNAESKEDTKENSKTEGDNNNREEDNKTESQDKIENNDKSQEENNEAEDKNSEEDLQEKSEAENQDSQGTNKGASSKPMTEEGNRVTVSSPSRAQAVVHHRETSKPVVVIPYETTASVAGVPSTVNGVFLLNKGINAAVRTGETQIRESLGLAKDEKLFAKIMDMDLKKSHLAKKSLDDTALALGGKVVGYLNMELGVMRNGQYSALTEENKTISYAIQLSDKTEDGNYNVIRVREGGKIEILSSQKEGNVIFVETTPLPAAYAIVKY